MLIAKLTKCSMLSMRVGIFVRIEKMHFVLVCSLGFSIFPSALHSALPLGLALGKVDCGFDFFGTLIAR